MALSSERSQHCPFLNRTDFRCGKHFHLEHLEHAFEFCFDRYTACSTYLERLVERRLRQDDQSHAAESASSESDSFESRAAQFRAQYPAELRAAEAERSVRQSLVQVTISAAVRSSALSAESVDAPIAIKLATAVPGPRISAGSIFRGFDRLARRTVFRETPSESANATRSIASGEAAGDAPSRAA